MRRWVVAGLLACAAVAGCGDDGPKRYRVSGDVTIDGQPVPFGEVIFTPDAAKMHSGPQGIAPIKDGKYDTALPGGMGAGGGPTVVRVNGMSGPGGKTLCEYETPLDLPQADSTQKIDVPKAKAGPKRPDAKEI